MNILKFIRNDHYGHLAFWFLVIFLIVFIVANTLGIVPTKSGIEILDTEKEKLHINILCIAAAFISIVSFFFRFLWVYTTFKNGIELDAVITKIHIDKYKNYKKSIFFKYTHINSKKSFNIATNQWEYAEKEYERYNPLISNKPLGFDIGQVIKVTVNRKHPKRVFVSSLYT